MIKFLYIVMTVSVLSLSAFAKYPAKGFEITGLAIEENGDNVKVSFEGAVTKKYLDRNQTLYILPVITDGVHKVSLEPVAVTSRRGEIISERKIRAAKNDETYPEIRNIHRDHRFTYISNADYQPWMSGASIQIESFVSGCCASVNAVPFFIANNILNEADTKFEPELIINEVIPVQQETAGQEVEKTFSFVFPASELDPQNLIVYDDERDNAIIIYYRINESKIAEDYSTNQQSLLNLELAIRLITESPDSEVKYVVVAGFASPDGPFDFNDRLAFERAVAVKEYLINKTDVAPELIHLYNGSADWRGLKILIENSDLPSKEKVLDIIETVPIWDSKTKRGRMGEIMRLQDGEVYRYMAEHIFHKLRNGAFIRVYYSDK